MQQLTSAMIGVFERSQTARRLPRIGLRLGAIHGGSPEQLGTPAQSWYTGKRSPSAIMSGNLYYALTGRAHFGDGGGMIGAVSCSGRPIFPMSVLGMSSVAI
jgi:hypothetical protein